MGGTGKTTMAKDVFDKLSYQYDTCCFLENVRGQTEKNGLECVCKSLVSKLLGEDMQSNAFISRMLSKKKALVVLDDIDSCMQLVELHDKICDHLKKGSKVIIITRDQQWLLARGFEIHEAKGLNYDNSRQLFIYYAFRSGHADNGYEELIEGFVRFTKHNPLALKVLGSLVCTEPKKTWDDLMKKLRAGNPDKEIQNALRLSYNGLDDNEKQVFLDIACFFKGQSKQFVEELLKSFGFDATGGMQKLINRALISMTTDGNVEMHDLIQEMGHQIVHEENLKEPGKRSRLWDPKETINVLKSCEGKKVEGIMLDFSGIGQLELKSETFKNMKELRYLAIYRRSNLGGNISFSTSHLEFISSEIRYFHWEKYPGKSLPSIFCVELLLELNLAESKVETLWEGVQDLANLRILKLQQCKKLRELPDFSKACMLESIDLSGCKSLREVPDSLLRLHSLISLDVRSCTSLESLQSEIHLKSLKQVYASGCLKLKEFSLSSEELTSLDLRDTVIEELRSSMSLCSKIKTLKLPLVLKFPKEALNCLRSLKKLVIHSRTYEKNDGEELSKLFDHLCCLKSLCLTHLLALKELPGNITQLSGLEELHLDGCESLTKLPDNIRHLSNLQLLSLKRCYELQSLPELPPSLRTLDAYGCVSLERVSISSTLENYDDKVFSFKDCDELDVKSIEEQAMRVIQNAVEEKEEVAIIYPGKKVPKWFYENGAQHEGVKLFLSSSHNLLGFVFCIVSESFPFYLDLLVRDEGNKMINDAFFSFPKQLFHPPTFDSGFFPGNVYLISTPELSKSILEKLEGKRRTHGGTTYNPTMSFKFFYLDKPIRESGVYPIYASQRSNYTKMASASSSSRFEPKCGRKYDVFISFRGKDTRANFTSHLHAALIGAYLEVFLDDQKLQKGEEMASSLIQAITDSSISLIVFSQDYASSKWCLDELAHIMKYRKEEGQFVIPIFYKVEPRDVRGQKGDYEKAFETHEIDFKDDPSRVNGWRSALSEAGQLSGHHINAYMDENNIIEKIIADVKTKLEHIYKSQSALEGLIGIDEMIKPIEELLQKSDKVGIWGMGGAGKTTMAKIVLAKLSNQYDTSYVLENVREQTKKKGLECVSDCLVSNILGQDMPSNALLSRMLSNKKALVVLDDVDSFNQLEELHDKICGHLKKGSKVIITSRDQHLLRACGFDHIHEAEGLNDDNSRQLFIYNAFRSGHPDDGYEELIKGFVHYAKHNPLALKVLGLLVCSEPKEVWDDLLKKLRAGNPNDEIQNVLRLSYDGLDHKEKQVFLDIACFFKGENKEFVKELLESFGFYPTCGMQKLINRALIIVTTDGNVEMHDLLQEMGHQIVREENLKEPGKRSRLWDPNETIDVLKNCEGIEVEGIMMDITWIEQFELAAKTFNNMKKLRFLKNYSRFMPIEVTRNQFIVPITDLQSISSKIRYFHWTGYPWKSLPSNFCVELLLELNLGYSQVETLWEGVQDLANLRRLKLRRCKKLRELPDFSKACKLESIDLSFCESLHEVPKSLLRLNSLISLDVSHCSSLESLQSGIYLKSLKQVDVYGCFNLKEFSMSSEELTTLDLRNTEIVELRPSMGLCSKLRTLKLPTRLKLKNVPTEVLRCLTSLENLEISIDHIYRGDMEGLHELFDHLHSLKSLRLSKLLGLKELPDNITKLSYLEELHLDYCESLIKLPDNMRNLSHLKFLSLEWCDRLERLPKLPPSLRTLNVDGCDGCNSLERASISSTPENCGDKLFSFKGCYKLDVRSIEEQAMRVLQNAFPGKEEVLIIYPGEKVPEWFGDNRTRREYGSHTLQLSLSSSHNLLGFVFCLVSAGYDAYEPVLSVKDEEGEIIHDDAFGPSHPLNTFDFDSRRAHVYLFSRPDLSTSILENMECKRRRLGPTTYNPILSFKFYHPSLLNSTFEPRIDCGVYPIYDSQSSDFNVSYMFGK